MADLSCLCRSHTTLTLGILHALGAAAKLTSPACYGSLCLQMRVQADGTYPLRLYPDADIPIPPGCDDPHLLAILNEHSFNNSDGRAIAYYRLDSGSYLGGPFNFPVPPGSTHIVACATGWLRKQEMYTTCWMAQNDDDFAHPDVDSVRCDLAYGRSTHIQWDTLNNIAPPFGALDWFLIAVTLLEIPLNILQLAAIFVRIGSFYKRDNERNGLKDNEEDDKSLSSKPTDAVLRCVPSPDLPQHAYF